MDKPEAPSSQQARLPAESMILKVRRDLVHRRFHFLLWGWTVFLAFVVQYLLKVVVGYAHHYFVWAGLFPVVAVTIIKSKQRQKQVYSSLISDCMQYLWTGLGISFFIVGLIGSSSVGSPGTELEFAL